MTSQRRYILVGLALLAGVLFALLWGVHYRDKWAVARYRQRLLAAGEKLGVEQLLPPMAPPEQNGAAFLRQTVGAWNRSPDLLAQNAPAAMQMVAPGKAMLGWAQPKVQSDRTNTWAEIEVALDDLREDLDLVREAAQRPVLDFGLDYRQGPSLPLPHLAPLKRAAQRLSAAALCELHRGEVAGAVTNVQVILALVKATAGERLAISQLVRIAIAQIGFATTWELLQAPAIPDERLAALQRDWTGLSLVGPAEEALEMERALGQMTLEQMRRSATEFRQLLSLSQSGPGNAGPSAGQAGEAVLRELIVGTKEVHWRLALSYPDQLRALKGHQALLESLRQVRAGQSFASASGRQQARLAELGLQATNEEFGMIFDPSGPDLRFLFSHSVVALSRILHRVCAAETARELAVTAIALKRYQLAHSRYPAELSALVPAFLPAMPRDPADGLPLRYRLNPDGTYALYSVSEDAIDNGGDGSPPEKSDTFGWARGRDLVWPLAATPEEVAAYRQKHTKKR